MLPQDLRDKAPAALLIIASAILTAAFALPVGPERRMGTSYQRLEGWVGAFNKPAARSAPESPSPTSVAASAQAASRSAGLPSSDEQTAAIGGAAAPARKRSRAKRGEDAKVASNVVSSSAPAKIAPPVFITPAAPIETADNVADDYEGNAAKYPLDGESVREPVTLRLRGISRSAGRFILKVAVSNRGREDFFVKELSIRDGHEILESRFFMRLFVEPGRTREGYVVFSKPRNGASIHVALKEDRENGRSLDVAVRYPF